MYIKKISKFAIVAALMGSVASHQLYASDGYDYEGPAQPAQITGTPVAPSFKTVARSTVETALVSSEAIAEINKVAGASVSVTEVRNIVREFFPSTVTTNTLKKRTLTPSETAVLTQLAVSQPSVVANLAFKYFQEKDNLDLGGSTDVMPKALVEILKTKPSATAALVKDGGFMDFKDAQPSVATVPEQVLVMMEDMDADSILSTMDILESALPKGDDGETADGAALPERMRKAQGAKQNA